jgi:hypothetical protein
MMQAISTVLCDVAFKNGGPLYLCNRLTKILLNLCGDDFFSFAEFDWVFLYMRVTSRA